MTSRRPTCRVCPAPPASPDAGDCMCVCHKAQERAENWREMSRADRRGNMCLDPLACDDGEEHSWVPVSFVFETQCLGSEGRVLIRQPKLKGGRVYVVCMACRTHTYVETEWAGYFLGGPDYSALEPGDEDDPEREGAEERSDDPSNASDLGEVS